MSMNVAEFVKVSADNVHEKLEEVGRQLDPKLATTHGIAFAREVRALWQYMKDRPSKTHLIMGVAALMYFISPMDAIPDIVPVAGYLDDAAVIAASITAMGSAIDKYRKTGRKFPLFGGR